MNRTGQGSQTTKGQVEADISEAIIKFEKEYIAAGRWWFDLSTHGP